MNPFNEELAYHRLKEEVKRNKTESSAIGFYAFISALVITVTYILISVLNKVVWDHINFTEWVAYYERRELPFKVGSWVLIYYFWRRHTLNKKGKKSLAALHYMLLKNPSLEKPAS